MKLISILAVMTLCLFELTSALTCSKSTDCPAAGQGCCNAGPCANKCRSNCAGPGCYRMEFPAKREYFGDEVEALEDDYFYDLQMEEAREEAAVKKLKRERNRIIRLKRD
eukprot:154693_1